MLELNRPAAASFIAALLLTFGSACAGTSVPSVAPAAQVQPSARPVGQQLSAATQSIDAALADLDTGDLASARLHYGTYDDAWDALEDEIRDPHPEVYDAIERAMDQVDEMLLKADSPSPAVAAEALRSLRQTIDAQAPRLS